MSDGIDKSVNLKMNFDGRGVVSGVETTKQAVTSLAATLKKDFDSIEGSSSAALAALANDIRAIDSELGRLGRAVNRGSGIDQSEAINALTNRLNLLKATMQQIAPDNFMEDISNEALMARANLSHVETMMQRIQALNATIDTQRGIRGIYDTSGVMSVNDPRFQNALLPQKPSTLVNQQGTHDVLHMIKQTEEDNKRRAREQQEEHVFYQRLQRDEDRKQRQEEKEWNKYVTEETRREERDFYQTLSREEKVKANKESERLEQTLLDMRHRVNPVDEVNQRLRPTTYQEHSAYGMVRDAGEQAEINRRQERARELDRQVDYHYEQQRRNNNAAEREWLRQESITRTPTTTKEQDKQYRIQRARELDIAADEHYRLQRQDNIATENAWRYQNAINRRGNRYENLNRRQFIAQQAAFGIDDIVQQYMWSNSTASGISAAARAGGNNLTAIAGATNISPTAMIGSMLAIQGVAFAASSIAKYYDEVEKARVSTKGLEEQLASLERRTQKELKFKYSLEDKSASELASDEKAAERELEGLESGKYKRSADKLAAVKKRRQEIKAELETMPEKWVKGYKGVLYHPEYIDASRRLTAEDRKLAEEEKVLTPDANKYYEDKVRLAGEKPEREEAIKRKAAAEARAEKRKKDGELAAQKFWAEIEREQQRTGITLSGEEVQERWSNFVSENPHLNLGETSRIGEEKKIEQDSKYIQARNEASDKAWQNDSDYQIERDYRNDRYGREKVKYRKELMRIEREFKNASPEERTMLKENAREQLGYDIQQRTEEYDTRLRSNYKALSGITAGSEEEAQLRAKLTVDSGMKTEQEKQTKQLEIIAANTKPRKPPEPRVVSIA